eukprot:1043191-Pelagomonas_calceolata.AAC.4
MELQSKHHCLLEFQVSRLKHEGRAGAFAPADCTISILNGVWTLCGIAHLSHIAQFPKFTAHAAINFGIVGHLDYSMRFLNAEGGLKRQIIYRK